MSKIPRKIEKEKLQGFVIIKEAGPSPYETEEDKEELVALAELYVDGLKRGGIVRERGQLAHLDGNFATSSDYKVLNILGNHMIKNLHLFSSSAEADVLDEIRKKNNKDILILEGKNLHKVFPQKKSFLKRLFFKD